MQSPTLPLASTSHYVPTDSPDSLESFQPFQKLRERRRLSDVEQTALERLAFEYGDAPESYFITEPGAHCLLSPNHTAALSVVKHGWYWHAAGGLLADEPDKPAIIKHLKELGQREGVMIAVYSISPNDAPLFAEAGYDINKFGEEPVLDLGDLNWSGKPFEWIRRQSNFCLRQGLTVREIRPQSEPLELTAQLRKILEHDLNHRPYTKELALMEGRFLPENLLRRRLFVVESADRSRVEAFLCCHPMSAGLGWSFETYRRRADAPRGTIPFLMRTAIDRLQEEGARHVSLCMIPGKGVDRQSIGTPNPFVRMMLNFWYHRTNALFNLQGQEHFKTRFRPRFQDRYVAATTKMNPVSLSSFLYSAGGFGVNPINAGRNFWRHLRKKQPDFGGE